MTPQVKYSLSGKSSLAALSALTLAVVGGSLFLVRPASAQASSAPPKPVQFAPDVLVASNVAVSGNNSLFLNCLLPEIKNLFSPYSVNFKVVCSTPDGDLAYPMESTIGAPTFCRIEVRVVYPQTGAGSYLELTDLSTGRTKTMAVSSSQEEVAIRIEPATNIEGFQFSPTSADLELQGNFWSSDLSTTPFSEIQQPYSK